MLNQSQPFWIFLVFTSKFPRMYSPPLTHPPASWAGVPDVSWAGVIQPALSWANQYVARRRERLGCESNIQSPSHILTCVHWQKLRQLLMIIIIDAKSNKRKTYVYCTSMKMRVIGINFLVLYFKMAGSPFKSISY